MDAITAKYIAEFNCIKTYDGRVVSCSEECKRDFKDGQLLTEKVDYEEHMDNHPLHKLLYAVPIRHIFETKSQDKMIIEFLIQSQNLSDISDDRDWIINQLKKVYTVTYNNRP